MDLGLVGKQFDGAPMSTDIAECIPITVAELKEVCTENLDHPKSKEFLAAVDGLPDGRKVSVEKIDLEGVKQNREVKRTCLGRDKKTQAGVFSKELGRSRGTTPPPPRVSSDSYGEPEEQTEEEDEE